MCFGGGSSASDQYAAEQRAAAQKREADIRTGMAAINQNFSKFNNDFYNQQGQNYLNFAMPQLNKQYTDATHDLGYALARQGIGASSEGNRRYGNLATDFQLQRQGVVDKSKDVANQARSDVENARSGLIGDLYATADPSAAAAAATSKAQYVGTQPAPSMLGQMFGNVLDGLNTYQQQYQNAQDYGSAMAALGGGMPSSSGRNVRG